MRVFAACLLAACTLAACGKDSSDEPAPRPPSGAEQAYVDRLRSLCVTAATEDAAAPRLARRHYREFVRALKRVQAPARLADEQRRRVAIHDRMLPSARTPAAVRRAYAADDKLDARFGLLDCVWPPGTNAADAYTRMSPASLNGLAPRLDRICADNSTRAAYALRLGGNGSEVDAAASERLSRLVRRAPRPSGAGARYTGWTDSLQTVVNLLRLAASADGDKAKALRDQAQRTAAASRRTARQLGLPECAKGDAAAAGSG